MQTWMSIEEFAALSGRDPKELEDLCEENKIVSRIEHGKRMIESASATQVLLPTQRKGSGDLSELSIEEPSGAISFVEKTIGTILNMHERVVDAKDETLDALRNENKFLKEGLLSMQELYEEDRKAIEALTTQLKMCQDELEFMRRKYKLMWGKVVENASKDKNI